MRRTARMSKNVDTARGDGGVAESDAMTDARSATKQVIVVNGALELPPGKLAAQVAHAAVAGFLAAAPRERRRWLEDGMPKIVVRAAGEDELRRLQRDGAAAGLAAELIEDAGRTVVP